MDDDDDGNGIHHHHLLNKVLINSKLLEAVISSIRSLILKIVSLSNH